MDNKNSESNTNKTKLDGDAANELKTIIDSNLPENEKEKVIRSIIALQSQTTFSGPIPPPELLSKYNDIIPNGAERILIMAENQSANRISLEQNTINEQLGESKRGQYFGFAIGIVGMLCATFLGLYGHDWLAGIFGTTTIVSLVTVFVFGKKYQQKNLSEK